MRVKRYVVDSMPDALQKIRTDLGKDAVILNTKEIRSGGFLGMFGKKKIEVIAAVDGIAAGSGASSKPVANRSAASKPQLHTTSKPITPVALMEQERLEFPEVPDVLPPASSTVREELPARKGSPLPAQTPSVQSGVYSPPRPAPAKSREDQLFEELKQMREMMHKLTLQGSGSEATLPNIRERLAEQEVDASLVETWLDRAKVEAEELGVPYTESFASRSVRSQMGDLLRPEGGKSIAPETKIAHFVGPTGVGKTTTIAKLAAEQVLKHRRKVGFITSDTYRISAVEQLRTYANILNVPLEVVFSPQDLLKAFESLKDCDLIFMDTAGRNFRNEMYVSELNALLRSQGDSETYLVLSMTTKYKDMKAITGNFTKFKLDKVLFTKMDETDSYGAVVNLIRDFGLQLSYVANGQNVPDDITEVNEQAIIDLILEELPDE